MADPQKQETTAVAVVRDDEPGEIAAIRSWGIAFLESLEAERQERVRAGGVTDGE